MELSKKLVSFLERPNSRIVDVSLSILGNLAMYDKARAAIIDHGGVQALIRIISTLAEEKILGRACRVIANVAMDNAAASDFHKQNAVRLILKIIKEVVGTKSKGAAVRAVRILCETKGAHRKVASDSNALILITSILKNSNDLELIKVVIKCLAILTEDTHRSSRGCGSREANTKLVLDIEEHSDEFKKIIELVDVQNGETDSGSRKKTSKRIWVPAMTVLYNLSHHTKLRLKLGAAGIVPAFVYRLQNYETSLSSKEFVQFVNALFLYCHESVNRIKLREQGGLQFFVSILSSRQSYHRAVHKVVLGSLVTFGYDGISMKVSFVVKPATIMC